MSINISRKKASTENKEVICALCGEPIKKNQKIYWLPEYNEKGEFSEMKPYHYLCRLKVEPGDLKEY